MAADSFDRDAVADSLRTDAEWLVEVGVLDAVTDDEIDALVDRYDTEYDLSSQLSRLGHQSVVARLCFDLLADQSVGLSHDAECLYGYESYGDLLDRYADLTDGLLAGFDWQISGDWCADDPAYLTLALTGTTVTESLRYGGDWIDTDGFLSALNRLVETATEDDRRFTSLRVDTGTTVHVVFVTSDRASALAEYFDAAVDDAIRHRDG